MMRIAMALLLATTAGACVVGRRAENHPLAREARGAAVSLQTRSEQLEGELLAVQDTAIIVLTTPNRITLVPYRVIRDSSVELERVILYEGRPPSPSRRDALRRISRYPQGINPELMRTLLAAYQQSELEVIRQ